MIEEGRNFKNIKKKIILINGDNKRTVNSIAKKLGTEKVMFQVSPIAKALEIKNLQIN
jgi:cation transport ATPase